MKPLSNTAYVKTILLLATGIYILALVLGIFHNSGSKRYINIESTQQHGVVVIRNVKYPTPFRMEQARIGYTVTNPVEYLLIPSGIYQESLLSALLKLIIAVLFGIFVWKFDFHDPFRPKFLTSAYLIYRLFIGSIILGWVTSKYTSYWSNSFFYQSDYHTYSDISNITGLMMVVVLLTVGIYLYTRAVKNQQELELTI
jgi:hypothetical protein